MGIKNSFNLFIGKRRWLKRHLHGLMDDQAYCQVDDLKVHVSAKDLRGPSFYLMYGGSDSFDQYEKPAKDEVVSCLPDNDGVFFDIGANIGLFSLYAHRKKKNLRSFLFEPHPIISECVQKTISNNNIQKFTLIKKALSNAPGTMTFFMDAINDGGHSLLADQIEDRTDMAETTVQVSTLDEVVKSNQVERVDAIKIDVQGAEHMVLEGGRETLQRFGPPLLIECENIALEGEHSLLKVLKSLDKVKYFVRRIGHDEKLELDELLPIAKKLYDEGVMYQDFLFFTSNN